MDVAEGFILTKNLLTLPFKLHMLPPILMSLGLRLRLGCVLIPTSLTIVQWLHIPLVMCRPSCCLAPGLRILTKHFILQKILNVGWVSFPLLVHPRNLVIMFIPLTLNLPHLSLPLCSTLLYNG